MEANEDFCLLLDYSAYGEIEYDNFTPSLGKRCIEFTWTNLKTAFQNKNKMKTKLGQSAINTKTHWLHWNAMLVYSRYDLAKSTPSISTTDFEDAHLESDEPAVRKRQLAGRWDVFSITNALVGQI